MTAGCKCVIMIKNRIKNVYNQLNVIEIEKENNDYD